mmetsp:Transcript_70766/g.169412  ORF Transcript_70766/g.169412 Transcript_70766/m.169412 type:complete len:297 (-) Transcript_70766:375-1265(-)|eukprot:CAMPEP_0178439954 /NCGR_PEP_ID=MMETSP0689_2-20121128/36474_1 /TAXON_ID=160604 /ORGANISM="Amphidinium massartii, Strain CS-259" /LENGTH=296 /DNA_ID=CAMNT_0020062603 /DNA_START=106 /DNA_END=996 /DNA_ORIENTATION=+
MVATVGEVLKNHGPNVVCPSSATLTDVADVMTEGGRTSALIQDGNGKPIGVITANDLLAAFVEGVGWEASAAKWLAAGDARLPGSLLPTLSVKSSSKLEEAAELMANQKGTDHASHHVVVTDQSDAIIGVLSALDVARAICINPEDDVSKLLSSKTVESAMKKRSSLPECSADSSLAQAFREMFAARQNAVVIVEDAAGGGPDSKKVEGIITPRDVLRAFAEHVAGQTTAAGWLRGVQSSIEPRTVGMQASLSEAATTMASHTLHHVIAVDPPSADVQGILSALDLVCALAASKAA